MPGTYLLVGKPGSGKTTLATTLEHPTDIIDIDCKADRMANLRPLVDAGKVRIHSVRVPLVSESMSDRLKAIGKLGEVGDAKALAQKAKSIVKEPQGYYEIVRLTEAAVNRDPPFEDTKTLVYDSLTRLDEHLQRLVLYYRARGSIGDNASVDMGWPGWGKFKQILEEFFTLIVQADMNIICCAHEIIETERDPLTDAVKVLGIYPNLSGSIRTILAGFFDEVYWLENKIVKDPERGNIRKYYVITADRQKPVRTSMILNGVEEANLARLVDKQKLLKG